MPQVGEFYESYRTNEFVLEVDHVPSPGITKVSGLSEGELETIEQPDGGTKKIYKIAGKALKFEPLTIERYVDGSEQDRLFRKWVQETFGSPTSSTPGSTIRKSGLIKKLHNGEPVLTFAFYNAWVKSSKFTDLEAGSNNAFKQTLVLEHEGLERVG